jgi:hypothetical protein
MREEANDKRAEIIKQTTESKGHRAKNTVQRVETRE